MLASRNTSHICIVSHTWTSGIPGRRVRWSGWRQGWLGRDGETRTCPTWSTVSNHFRFSLQGMEKGYTGCSAGTVKNYLLIAQAIKQPISFDMCHFFHWIRTFWYLVSKRIHNHSGIIHLWRLRRCIIEEIWKIH